MNEKQINPLSGYLMLLVCLLLAIGIGYGVYAQMPFLTIGSGILLFFITTGFFYINPNESRVLTLFGKYIGSVRDNGFFCANPFYGKKKFSFRASNCDSERVNDDDKR